MLQVVRETQFVRSFVTSTGPDPQLQRCDVACAMVLHDHTDAVGKHLAHGCGKTWGRRRPHGHDRAAGGDQCCDHERRETRRNGGHYS